MRLWIVETRHRLIDEGRWRLLARYNGREHQLPGFLVRDEARGWRKRMGYPPRRTRIRPVELPGVEA